MKHACAETLRSIDPLLQKLRALPGMQEKKPGVFYRKSRAFLHFHEDGDCLYADVRLVEPDFKRMPVNSAREQNTLLKAIREAADQ